MVVPVGRHAEDRPAYPSPLLPSVGLLVGAGQSARNHYEFDGKDFGLAVEAEPVPRRPAPELTLEMLWAAELATVCDLTDTARGKKSTRATMIKSLLELDASVLMPKVCAAAAWSRRRCGAPDPPLPVARALTSGLA